MFRLLTILFFCFCLLTTAVAFGRSTSYFEATITHMFSSECNSHCRSKIIKYEVERPNATAVVNRQKQKKRIVESRKANL